MMMLKKLLRKNNYSPVLIIIFLIILQSCASKPDVKLQEPDHSINIIETLRQDYESKILTNDVYYLYMTYTIFSRDLLPKEYKGMVGPRDGTPIIMEVQRAYYSLQPETQKIIQQWIKPLPQKPARRKP
ncbi:uncharacterized protein METZ01_LOCUS232965 [marine metagenome]|uniref:DUF4296 domain-containing protein n=1 Tax=marine metagenome TaxID=408172 RepID=A0A382H0Y5_9ZZZZ